MKNLPQFVFQILQTDKAFLKLTLYLTLWKNVFIKSRKTGLVFREYIDYSKTIKLSIIKETLHNFTTLIL